MQFWRFRDVDSFERIVNQFVFGFDRSIRRPAFLFTLRFDERVDFVTKVSEQKSSQLSSMKLVRRKKSDSNLSYGRDRCRFGLGARSSVDSRLTLDRSEGRRVAIVHSRSSGVVEESKWRRRLSRMQDSRTL